jgi:phage terminase large subunit-like protein
MRHRVIEALRELGPEEMRVMLATLPAAQRRALDECWAAWAHEGQLAAPGDWPIWMLMAGRGFGKTRAGAEWVSQFARDNPGASIAVVAATAEEARSVMIEGRSGLLAAARFDERAKMKWEPSRRRLLFASGAEAFLYSGANPEGLRGPEHHAAWCDEMAKWRHWEATWNNLRLGLRLGARPRAVVTTTPRAARGLKRLLARTDVVTSGGASWANPHVAEAAVAELVAEHKDTRFGRQELEGVLIEDVDGALWTRETIEKARVAIPPQPTAGEEGGGGVEGAGIGGSGENLSVRRQLPLHHAAHGPPPHRARWGGTFRRVVIGVDPPASAEGDACGIVVCGLGEDGIGYVLADLSVAGLSPEGWARRVAAAAEAWGADRVIAEKNNGGAMVEAVLRGAEAALPVTLVHAADGKAARAAPVAARFERGMAKLAGRFPELEDQLAGLTYGGGYEGPGRSPDRADAMVWALTELIVKRQRPEPRITRP